MIIIIVIKMSKPFFCSLHSLSLHFPNKTPPPPYKRKMYEKDVRPYRIDWGRTKTKLRPLHDVVIKTNKTLASKELQQHRQIACLCSLYRRDPYTVQ